jgi:hypothetical protein
MTITRRRGVLGACLLTLVAVGVYWLGVHNTKQATWHSVTIDLANVAADESGPHRLLAIRVDGWTYAIEDSVKWVDRRNGVHDSGWPQCLEPRHPGFMARNHEKVRFSFAEVSADTGIIGWRPVVMVDCAAQA